MIFTQAHQVLIGCNQRLLSLAKIRKYIPREVALLIYKALVMSKLSYGNVLCINASKDSLSRIQRLQNRALRICQCTNRYTSNIKLHQDTSVLPVFLRRKLDLYKIMYKRMLLSQNPAVTHLITAL